MNQKETGEIVSADNMMPPINSLVMVHWDDAWFQVDESSKNSGLKTFLFGVIRDISVDGIKIATEFNEYNEWRNFHYIPLNMVKNITVLRKPSFIKKYHY